MRDNVHDRLTRITRSRWLRLHEILHACTVYIRSDATIGIRCKNEKKGDDDDDEISRRRLDGFAIRLSARSSVSAPAHYRIRAFLASILASSLFLLFIPNVPIFRLDSADSLRLLLSLSPSLFLHRERIYLPRSVFIRPNRRI